MQTKKLFAMCILLAAGMHATAATGDGRTTAHSPQTAQPVVIKAVTDGQGRTLYMPFADEQAARREQQAARHEAEGLQPMVFEMTDGHMTRRPMTPTEAEARRVADLTDTSGHVITGYTPEGVAMTFMVTDEAQKTCQVGIGSGNSASTSDVAIDSSFDGTLTIPERVNGYTVTAIGNAAFYYCTKLKGVTIPTTVEQIGFCAFDYCRSMKTFHLPASVSNVSHFFLENCDVLETITVDPQNTVYDSRGGCNAIIHTAYNSMVAACMNTVIPNTVTDIDNGSFVGCVGLKQLRIPASVSYVGGQAFDDCVNVTTVTVDTDNPKLDSRDGCNAIIRTADNTLLAGFVTTEIPATVTAIQGSAFAGMTPLQQVTLPKGLTKIESRAFEKTPNLLKVVAWMPQPFDISENTFTIHYGTFNSEATLYVPLGKKSLYQSTPGWSLFSKVVEMNSGPDDPVVDQDEFTAKTAEGVEMKFKVLDREKKTCQVGWRSGGSSYSSSDASIDWTTTGTVTIPAQAGGYTVTQIAGAAFYGCRVSQVVIPTTVETIEDFAFSSMTQMPAIHIPASVTSIASYALADSEGPTSITVDKMNPVYDSREDCNAIIETATGTMIAGCKTTTFPASVTALGHAAFYGSDATNITIGKGVKSIGLQTFSYSYSLETLAVEEGNPYLDSRDNCGAIIETATNRLVKAAGRSEIPATVTAIGSYVVEGNSILEKLTIPAAVTTIGNGAFYSCSKLYQVTSLIEQPFAIGENSFLNGTVFPEYLYVPVGTKQLYEATPGWNRFRTITEVGTEAQIDIDPAPNSESNFLTDLVDEDGDVIDLTNTVVGDLLFSLDSDSGDGFDVSEGCVVLNSLMTDEAVNELVHSVIGSDEFTARFSGIIFAVSAGRGTITIDVQTLGSLALSVKIGGGAVVNVVHTNRDKVVINYNVESDTYVFIYARSNSSRARGQQSVQAADNSLKIFSIGWERTGDANAIETSADAQQTPAAYYTPDGRRLQQPQRGLNIVRYANGTSRKVVIGK